MLVVTLACHRPVRGCPLGECRLVVTMACHRLSEDIHWVSAGLWSLWPVTYISEAVRWVNACFWSLWSVTDLSEAVWCAYRLMVALVCHRPLTGHLLGEGGLLVTLVHSFHRAVKRHCVAAPAGGHLLHFCCPQAMSREG